MMSVAHPTVLLIGGPETGKSNFLFKVWMHINFGKGLVEKDGLPDDVDYLRTGTEYQLRCQFAPHTSQDVQVISKVPIRLKDDRTKRGVVVVPDIDGEQIDRIYRSRRWSAEWESAITEDAAFLFFVRVNSPQLVAPLDWISYHALYGTAPCAAPERKPTDPEQPSTSIEPSAPEPVTGAPTEEAWDAGRRAATIDTASRHIETPTQVILVDWMQFIRRALRQKFPNAPAPRVGVVVSAWDCIAADFNAGPEQWIQENMPLLHQFCIANERDFVLSYFGSSIFSGDPENNPDFAEEIGKADPRTLGYVRFSPANQPSDDFTIPMVWALGWH